MLSQTQAREIAQGSIKKATGTTAELPEEKKLLEAGITDINLNSFVITVTADPQVGVPRLQHYLDPNKFIVDLNPAITIKELTDKILKLSAGKLCSNPNNPHEQECCPYPDKCPQCGYAVL
jgi:hypothetical protein